MAGTTTNLGLVLPIGTENVSRSVINSNNETIDAAIGAVPSGKTVQGQINEKADKVSSATNGNLAGLDSNGNLTDSGKKAADFATASNPVFTGSISMGRKSNTTVGSSSVATGSDVEASASYSHAEGKNTKATANSAHAEGSGSEASGVYSHAEGYSTIASGSDSHAEGVGTEASALGSHAQGYNTSAAGAYSDVAGIYNVVDSYSNFPEWTANTHYYVGDKVKVTDGSTIVGYICKTENTDSSFTLAHWTSMGGRMNYAEIVGNGLSNSSRSNARVLDWDGNERLKGDLYVGCNADSSGGSKVTTLADVATDEDTQAMIDDYYGGGD